MIDTNIAIHARDGTDEVLDKLIEHDGSILLSALSVAELQRGLYKNPALTSLRQARLAELLGALAIVPFGVAAAAAYGQIIAQCAWIKGRDFDLMIAAHAIATNSVLVNNNIKDFRDIPGLRLENWIAEH